MQYLIEILFKIYLFTIGISAGTKLLKDNLANSKIENQGYKINKDQREIKTIIYDYIKEYIYTLVPIKNIKIAKELLFESDKKYTRKRLEKLKKNGRIIENKIEEQEEKPKTNKILKETKEVKKQNDISQYIKEIEISKDIYFLNEIKITFNNKSKELRKRYFILVDLYKKTTDKNKKRDIKAELEKLCNRVKLYDQIYFSARNRIKELQPIKQNIKTKHNALS